MTDSENTEETTTPFPYKAGDVVQLKSGGNPMTVKGYDTAGNVICIWFNGTETECLYVAPEIVQSAAPDPKPEPCADCAQLRVELYFLLDMLSRKLEFADGERNSDFFLLSKRDALGREIFKL